MGLRDTAAADAAAILEDATTGFGWAIRVTDPEGTTGDLTGFSTDVGQSIDPDTGIAVAGRIASIAVRIAALEAAGLGIPRNQPDPTCPPWVVVFDDIGGDSHTYKVVDTMPDRALGIVVCMLEAYRSC